MNATINPIAVLLMVFVAVPLLAQQGNPPATTPAAAGQVEQQDASAATPSAKAEPARVVGTLVGIGDGRLELAVEKAVGPSVESASVLVGQTHAFVLVAGARTPARVKAGDRVEIWFTEVDGQGYAVRIAAADDEVGSRQDAEARQTSASAVDRHVKPLIPPAGPAALSPDAGGDAGDVEAPPASRQPALPAGVEDASGTVGAETSHPEPAAQPSDPLPFVGVGAAVTLVALALVFFTLRGRAFDFGLHAGLRARKGGAL